MVSIKSTRLAIVSLAVAINASAGELTVPHQFSAGSPALASEVNENFSAVKVAVDDNYSDISGLQNRIVELEQITTAQDLRISELEAQVSELIGSLSSSVAIPIFPRTINNSNDRGSFDSGKITLPVQFNLAMDKSSFNVNNVKISGSGLALETGTIVWSDGNSTLTFTSDSSDVLALYNACIPITLTITGNGDNAVKDLQGKPLDGDRDGVPGGNFEVVYLDGSCT